jgi:hypothetical protein
MIFVSSAIIFLTVFDLVNMSIGGEKMGIEGCAKGLDYEAATSLLSQLSVE